MGDSAWLTHGTSIILITDYFLRWLFYIIIIQIFDLLKGIYFDFTYAQNLYRKLDSLFQKQKYFY